MFKKLLLIISAILLSFNMVTVANAIDKEYFEIYNPTNWNTAIIDKNGKVLLRGLHNQSVVYLINDIFTKKPAYMYKKYTGENIVTVKNDTVNDSYEYKDISNRTLFYDLDANFLFEGNEFGSLYGLGQYILYSSSKGCVVYNTKTNENKIFDFDAFQEFADKIAFYNYNYSNRQSKIEIYDKELNLVKTIEGYVVDYELNFGDEAYLLIEKSAGDDKTVYNFIDKNNDILFANDVENKIALGDVNPSHEFIYDNKLFSYDLAKKEYISTETEINDEEKSKLKIELDPYYSETETAQDKENKSKIKEMLEDESVFISIYEYDGKKIYVANVDGEFIPASYSDALDYEGEGEYVNYYNIYDKNLNLLKRRIKNVNNEPLNYGIVVAEGKAYDFDFNLLKTFDTNVNLEKIEIDDKIIFLDRNDDRYNRKKNQNIYDNKLNLIKGNLEDITITSDSKWILLTDESSSKLYDKDFNVIKDFKRKIGIRDWQYNDQYIVFFDKNTDRFGLIDTEGNIFIDKYKQIVSVEDDYFVYQNGFKYGIMDFDKNVIASLSIFDDMKEDAVDKDYIVEELGY